MKLIIDIPDEMYQNVLNDTYCGTLCKELKNGTSLKQIRDEIDKHCSENRDRNDGLYIAMKIIDKYIK